MEDYPELIAKWEERTRQRGANLVNAEPQNNDGLPATNINIVIKGGQKTREDRYTEDPPLILKVASSQKGYHLECQKKYYQEESKMFEGMATEKDNKRP